MVRNWSELREELLDTKEARAEYERARRAYELGLRIRDQREAAGLTQKELADRIGSTQPAIARLEAGGQEPTVATLRRIASALGAELVIDFRTAATSTRKRVAKKAAKSAAPRKRVAAGRG
jgi:HTH-type transcriptional regulator / antitoxin HipB